VRLLLATEVTPLWRATEEWLSARGVPPPYWAFAWCGGVALAMHVLAAPERVARASVLDFACGSGVVGLAALQAGARCVRAVDVDPFAAAAVRLNAEANGVHLRVEVSDLLAPPFTTVEEEVILAGDVLYDRAFAEAVVPWLRHQADAGKWVLVGDPGRPTSIAASRDLPTVCLASYDVTTDVELEGVAQRRVEVRRVLAREPREPALAGGGPTATMRRA
jgi:predicted nicotinamide N-methyase